MANNALFYNAVIEGICGGASRASTDVSAGTFTQIRTVAAIIANLVDTAIAPVAGGATESQSDLLASICEGVFRDVWPTDASLDYSEQVDAIVTQFIAQSTVLLPTGTTPVELAWFIANWAVTDWYLDSITGNDNNNGTSALTALKTGEELARRLAVSLPVTHSVNVHLIAGVFTSLNIVYTGVNDYDRLTVLGSYTSEDLGTVTTYSTRVLATNSEAYLQVSGVANWAARKGKLIRVTAGAMVDATSSVIEGDPHAAGVGIAAVCQFSAPLATSLIGTTKVPVPGDPIEQINLAVRVERLCIETRNGLVAGAVGASLKYRAVIKYVDCGLIETHGSPCIIDSCLYEKVTSFIPSNSTVIVRCLSLGCLNATSKTFLFENVAVYYSSFLAVGGTTYSCSIRTATIVYCNFWGMEIVPQVNAQYTVFDCGISNSPASGIKALAFSNIYISNVYGRGNVNYGVLLTGINIGSFGGSKITGTVGDVYASGIAVTWAIASAGTWIDGLQRYTATLVNGTVVVPVRFAPAAMKWSAFLDTVGGVPGILKAVRTTDTTVTVSSYNAATGALNVADSSVISLDSRPMFSGLQWA